MQKPIKPIEPLLKDFPTPTKPNAKNYLGEPVCIRLDWIKARKEYDKNFIKYNKEMEVYEQIKFIRLIKNATEKYCLKSFKITKK